MGTYLLQPDGAASCALRLLLKVMELRDDEEWIKSAYCTSPGWDQAERSIGHRYYEKLAMLQDKLVQLLTNLSYRPSSCEPLLALPAASAESKRAAEANGVIVTLKAEVAEIQLDCEAVSIECGQLREQRDALKAELARCFEEASVA